jgi:hypothetical protein
MSIYVTYDGSETGKPGELKCRGFASAASSIRHTLVQLAVAELLNMQGTLVQV